ncbi:uncharacterized protein LOC126985815 isoform X2 [Eriocheir sinensis]|uniref:uncharacterized protein LOC126985815 isoform X2 n=1 Tax=Eriocheir sinensis TaxID=95602 RepID=UPI0021C60E95|nr:uncharacterized protein LOC126985815 isoform X2 [Eriocheir sinensis]
MEDIDGIDYEAELHHIRNKLQANHSTLERSLAAFKMEISAQFQQHRTNIINLKDKHDRAKQRMDELRQDIDQREVESSQAREDAERMAQELEKATLALRGKKEELERQKEMLADCVEKLKEKERWAAETRQRHQDKVSLAESSVELFKTHLGLDITCTHHNTFIVKFTQVSRTNPEAEYLLEIGLEEDKYRLLTSVPPLTCLPQLEEALIATGNLTACLVQIRKMYQRAENKRPLE